MIRKNFKNFLSISLATGILIGGATASAEVIGYVTESNGVRYEYSQEDLIESIINKTALYERYKAERLVALVDDKNGYIDAEDVIGAIIQASMNKERLNVNDYTESEAAKVVELEGVKRLDSNGQVLPGDQVDDDEDSEPEDEKLEYTDASYFEFDSSKGEITRYIGDGPRNVVIPNEIDGVMVTSIGPGAFTGNNLERIMIPSSVTSIGRGAFSWNNLDSVEIPNSVISIGEWAFGGNNLESVEIPNSVISIGKEAFAFNGLAEKDVKLGSGHPSFWLYNGGNSTQLIGHILGGNNGVLIIPEGVTSIGEWAFWEHGLTSVEIPSSVTSIGWSAFSANNLESVEIPNSVTSIGEGAFSFNSLRSIEIPSSVTSIGGSAFSYNNLESVRIPSHTNIDGSAFDYNVEIIRY